MAIEDPGLDDDGTERLVREAAFRRIHLDRLSNQTGSSGEQALIASLEALIPRPRGADLRLLLHELERVGISIAGTSFDAILLPENAEVDLGDVDSVRRHLPAFIEIKSINKALVREDFSGFFFSLTEKEIDAARQLGERHLVLLQNMITGALVQSSFGEIAARS